MTDPQSVPDFELVPPSADDLEHRRTMRSADRKQQIMEAVVEILSARYPEKFTIKEIAARADVSEAGLYRHFTSKTQILEGIIAFCDVSIRQMCADIDAQPGVTMLQRALLKVQTLLRFAETNLGLTRILDGEALIYEDNDLAEQVGRILAKAETSIRQSLKLAAIEREIPADTNFSMHANLMMSFVEGRWRRFSRSGYKTLPTEGWATAGAFFARLGR